MALGSALSRIALVFIFLLVLPALSHALPEYSGRTGEGCGTCHLDAMGGALSEKGLEYAASGYLWPPKGGYRVLGPIRKPVRFVIGFMHVTASFMWFGTILYVHLLLRPVYAAKGLPKGEVVLGMASMAIVGVTGVLLTVSRVKGLDVLYTSPWGVVLFIKILIYILMISSALFVVAFVGPRLKRREKTAAAPEDGVYDPVTLSGFDGQEGRPAYIAYKGSVYEVSGLRLWKGGKHVKHLAGLDLTEALPKAPHGEEKLEPLDKVGPFDAGLRPPRSWAEKAFYFIAYMNLSFVFLVILVISYWRWGL
jgi:predicted heme/steroid binding protein